MFGISGSNLFSMAAEIGVGAMTGGTSLAVEMAAQTVVKSVVSEAIQLAGQQLGLPQSAISDAQTAATGAQGDLGSVADEASSAGQQFGLSPFEQGQFSQSAQSATQSLSQMLLDGVRSAGNQTDGTHGTHGKSGGMSVLMAIATAMGKVMDDKLNSMASQAQQLGSTSQQSSQYGQLTSQIQAESQELSMLSSAVSNSIKSIGDAASTMAKKD